MQTSVPEIEIMPGSKPLLSLPARVMNEVLGCWVSFAAIVRLTAAHRYSHFQTVLESFLRSEHFRFSDAVDCSHVKTISWMLAQGFRATNVVFKAAPEHHSISRYLRKFGRSVRRIECDKGLDGMTTLLIAGCCSNLVSVKWTLGTIPPSFRDLLCMNPNILEIRFAHVSFMDQHVFHNMTLPNLRILSVDTSNNNCAGFPWTETTFSSSLTVLNLNSARLMLATYQALMRNCPHIKAFGMSNISLDTSPLLRILRHLPLLLHLDISHNILVDDVGIYQIATTLTKLKSINIQKCKRLTDKSMMCIASLPDLQCVYMDINNPDSPETEHYVEEFSQKCTNLEYLHINSPGSLVQGTCAYSLLGGCPHLRTLVVSKMSMIGATVMRFVSDVRPCLRVVEHTVQTEYDNEDMALGIL